MKIKINRYYEDEIGNKGFVTARHYAYISPFIPSNYTIYAHDNPTVGVGSEEYLVYDWPLPGKRLVKEYYEDKV